MEPTRLAASPNANRLLSKTSMIYVRGFENVAVLPARLISRVLKRQTVVMLDLKDLKSEITYVIVANHQCRLDPFMISGLLPKPVWNRLMPLRPITYVGLFRSLIPDFVLVGLGCFPSHPHSKLPHGIEFASQLQEIGQTVLIFPEGTRTRPGGKVRPGVKALVDRPQTMLIPVYFNWYRGGWFKRFDAVMGKPIEGANMSPEEVMETVYRLRDKL